MWSSDRRRLLGGLALGGLTWGLAWLTAGCFRPMLAEGEASRALTGRIELPEVRDRFSYHLNRSLAERLGEAGAPAYRLAVETRLERESLAITQDDAITRVRLTAVADWALFPVGAAEPVLRESTRSRSGYNSTASLFATREVARDVERRLARDLGERIARRLLARAERIAAAAES